MDPRLQIAAAAIESNKEDLQALSDEIWRNPELGFKENKAHQLLTDFLEKKGFSVERGYCDISTAFRATFGSGGPNVCVICEYDALPEIGHACGHNLIAEAGVAAGLGVKAFLEETGSSGRLTVMGTPAEEGEGGKVFLIEKGAFEGIDLAMMVHPAPYDVAITTFAAMCSLDVVFTGKAAHAAGFPWEGLNALDAAVMAYNSVSVLRQQMKPSWRVHGVITNGGGIEPSIIPEKASMYYYIRAPTRKEVLIFRKKVEACFEAAAHATGCSFSITEPDKQFDNLVSNSVLVDMYSNNIHLLGGEIKRFVDDGGSTDMGNVSHVVPSIHPCYRIGNGEVYHTREFTSVTNTPEAHCQTLRVAKSMAFTCINVLTGEDQILKQITAQFKKDIEV